MKSLVKGHLITLVAASLGIIALPLGSGSMANADQPKPVSVDITSYQQMSQMQDASILAELCGFVHNQTGPMKLEVEVDTNTNNPGYYHTSTGTTGNFCQLVRTFGGHAKVTILDVARAESKTVSKSVSLDSTKRK